MYPTELAPCPARDQVHNIFQGRNGNLFVQTLPLAVSGPSSDFADWEVAQGATIRNPVAMRVCSLGRVNILHPSWSPGTITYVYYRHRLSDWTLADGNPLQVFWTWCPFFMYQFPPPIHWVQVQHITINVIVHCDRDPVSGPDDPTEWVVIRNGSPVQPFAVYRSASAIYLQHILFASGTLGQVIYTPGSTPYLATDGGALAPDNANVGYPP